LGTFEVAQIINLQHVRELARKQRFSPAVQPVAEDVK